MITRITLAAAPVIALLGTLLGPASAQEPQFTHGLAKTTNPSLLECGRRARIAAVGKISTADGKTWVVPAATHFVTGPKAADLYNECAGVTPRDLSQVDMDEVPLIDAGGEESFTAYIFADNYFELYINGVLVGVDTVPFTPFNSSVVRFKADRPLTAAVLAVDWEENLGLGLERGRGRAFHAGDGGFVAHIKDSAGQTVAVTDERWRAQTFYTAPLKDPQCLNVSGQQRDSSACNAESVADGLAYAAAHFAIPSDWMDPAFDDGAWPMATTFSNETVGVRNKRAFTNFVDVFDDADADAAFIWSSNLVLDNLVLLRTTID